MICRVKGYRIFSVSIKKFHLKPIFGFFQLPAYSVSLPSQKKKWQRCFREALLLCMTWPRLDGKSRLDPTDRLDRYCVNYVSRPAIRCTRTFAAAPSGWRKTLDQFDQKFNVVNASLTLPLCFLSLTHRPCCLSLPPLLPPPLSQPPSLLAALPREPSSASTRRRGRPLFSSVDRP